MTAPLPDLDEQVTVRAHGKVNLALCVGSREADGFHEIATVFHALSLALSHSNPAASESSAHIAGFSR